MSYRIIRALGGTGLLYLCTPESCGACMVVCEYVVTSVDIAGGGAAGGRL